MQTTIDALRLTPTLRACVCNVEMTPAVLLDRQQARLSGIDLTLIRHRRLDAEHADRIDQAMYTLEPLAERLAFVRPPFDLANVAATADAFDAGLLVLDYIQRIPPPGEHGDKRGSVNVTMDYIRQFADNGTAVIVLSAIGRTKDSKGRSSYAGEGQNLASYRESSELEYGADDAFLLIPDDDDGPFERVGECRLEFIAVVRLFGRRAYVSLHNPFAIDPDRERTGDGAAGYQLVGVLPSADAEHGVESLHDRTRVEIRGGQGAVVLHAERFPVDRIRRERRGQGERKLLRVGVHGGFLSRMGERMGAPLAGLPWLQVPAVWTVEVFGRPAALETALGGFGLRFRLARHGRHGQLAALHQGGQSFDVLAVVPPEKTLALARRELAVEPHVVLRFRAVATVGLAQTEAGAPVGRQSVQHVERRVLARGQHQHLHVADVHQLRRALLLFRCRRHD